MKSICIKAGIFAVILSFSLFVAACAASSASEESDASDTAESDTAVNSENDTCVLNLTFLDGEGNVLTGAAAGIAINDVASGTFSADENGTITVEDVPIDDSIDVTVYDENGDMLAVSRIYVYTADASMYTENSDGVLYLYIEEGVDGLSATMQINEEGTFDCVNLVS